MISFQDELIAGGDIDRAGPTVVQNVAAWNGTTWRAMGALGNSANTPRSFAVFQNALYTGGAFDGGYRHIARWDGSAWQTVGGGVDDGGTYVTSLLVWRSRLIAGGQFFDSNVPFADLSAWNGVSWSGFAENPQGTSARVDSLGEYRGDLVIGGEFTGVGGATSSSIARWNGSHWRGFSSGVSGCTGSLCRSSVFDYAVFNGELIVVGNFLSVDGISSPYIARWSETGVPVIAREPSATITNQGSSVSITAAVATGYDFSGAPAFQWLRNGTPVVDGPQGASLNGGTVTGATTQSLLISGLSIMDSGAYQLRVANTCGAGISQPISLRFAPGCGWGLSGCFANFNGLGGIDADDVISFFTAWDAGNSCADVNASGGVDADDVIDFFAAWDADGIGFGCQ
ncbi:MAG: hypothetical protein ACOYN0_11265 [Phycisphaerales bacterium]